MSETEPMNDLDFYVSEEWDEPPKPQTKRLTLHLTAEQIKALKIQAIESDQTVSAYVADMCMI